MRVSTAAALIIIVTLQHAAVCIIHQPSDVRHLEQHLPEHWLAGAGFLLARNILSTNIVYAQELLGTHHPSCCQLSSQSATTHFRPDFCHFFKFLGLYITGDHS